MLVNLFLQTGEPGQLAISLFLRSVIEQFPHEYVLQSRSFIPTYLTAIRKANALRTEPGLSVYLETLTVLLTDDAVAFVPVIFESAAAASFPHRLSRQLFNLPEFSNNFLAYILSFLTPPPASISVECIAHVTQTLEFFLEERFSDESHEQAVLAFLALVTVTSATFPRWTDAYLDSHVQHLETISVQILEGDVPDPPLPLPAVATTANLATVIDVILRKVEILIHAQSLLPFDDRYPHVRVIGLASLFQRDPPVLAELTQALANPEVVRQLPQLVPWLSPVFSHAILKAADASLVHCLIAGSLSALDSVSTIILAPTFTLFVRLLVVCDSDFERENLRRIFVALNNAILTDPQLIAVPEFSPVLFRLLDLCRSPAQLCTAFDSICLKMAAALICDSSDGRASAALFFRRLFASADLDCVFSSLASVFAAADGTPERYSRIADVIVKNAATKAAIPAADLEVLAKIVRPLAVLNDRKVTAAFVKVLEAAVAGPCTGCDLDRVLALLAEFTSPWLGRMRVAEH
jgi:hypothetical protein